MDEKLKLKYDIALLGSLLIIVCLCILLFNQSQLLDKTMSNTKEITRICQEEVARLMKLNVTRLGYG